jgi:ubiquinone/menaquinone biosynthesis C-methylase UbiE
VSALCQAAEREYQEIATADPQHLMALPFGNPMVAPIYLYNLGFLLAGLQLGRTMRVLDFGAGTCWLSRHLNEMGCATISLDPSPAALEIGRRLFREYPPVGGCIAEPVFLHFDGHTIELDDESVDRIVCNDAFHHVPNQREILREFARVLNPGGIVGFSEAGRFHSRSEGAQLEMRVHGVLENDIILEDIWAWAQEAGFTDIVVKPAFSPITDLSYEDYQTIARGKLDLLRHPRRVWSVLKRYFGLLTSITDRTDFMLHKGPLVVDSRVSFAALGGVPNSVHARDLRHEMRCDQTRYTVTPGEPVQVRVRVKNIGSVRWLHTNLNHFAMVKVGAHLHDGDMTLLDHDFLRAHLEHDVSPGQETTVSFSFVLDRPGRYNVMLDLVSERVAWFAQAGSEPVRLDVLVR